MEIKSATDARQFLRDSSCGVERNSAKTELVFDKIGDDYFCLRSGFVGNRPGTALLNRKFSRMPKRVTSLPGKTFRYGE